jgi:integrase
VIFSFIWFLDVSVHLMEKCWPGAGPSDPLIYRHGATNMRKKLTAAFVMNPDKPSKGRVVYWDTAQAGFGLRVTSTGHKSYVVQYRAGGGRKGTDRLVTIAATLKLDDARKEAKKIAGDVAKGLDPGEVKRKERDAGSTTVKAILEDYLIQRCGMSRDEDGNAIFDGRRRSGAEQLSTFERYVYQQLGEIQVEDLKRSKITAMLDGIAKKGGAVMADRALAYLRSGLNWYAARTDDWVSPIVRGMARTKPKERAGTRVLADDEIRDVWTALDEADDLPVCYARYVRTLLLTALRRNEASEGSWPEIETVRRDDFEGPAWTVPSARMKNKHDHAVPLTAAVLALIGPRPKKTDATPFIFSTTGGTRPFSGFSKAKAALDEQIAKVRKEKGREPMAAWTQHDLRRTAKTLMARAGVRPDISERVLAHTIPGVAGTYDRWEYLPEKLDALEKLAALIDRIVHPANNVVPLRQEA